MKRIHIYSAILIALLSMINEWGIKNKVKHHRAKIIFWMTKETLAKYNKKAPAGNFKLIINKVLKGFMSRENYCYEKPACDTKNATLVFEEMEEDFTKPVNVEVKDPGGRILLDTNAEISLGACNSFEVK